jgi:MFS family permease
MVFAGQTFGGALGNSIAGPLVDGQGFAALGLVTGALATLVVLGGIFLLPDRPRSQERRSGGAALGYGAILRRPSVVLLGLLRLLPTCYYGTTMLLVPLLIYRLAETPSAAAYYGTGALVFASLCQLLAGRLCDRFGRRVPVVVSCALIAAISLATAAFTGSLVGLYVCGILGVGFAWSLAVAVPGLVTDVAPPEERGRTLGFTHVAWYAGMIAGTQAAGWLVDYGSALPFVIMGLLNAVSVLLALALVRRIAGGSPQPAPSG